MPSRRQILQTTACGFGSLAFNALAAQESQISDSKSQILHPHFPARAKRIIFLFMKGGPSHVDTFDPKPSSPATTAANTPSKNPASNSPKPASY